MRASSTILVVLAASAVVLASACGSSDDEPSGSNAPANLPDQDVGETTPPPSPPDLPPSEPPPVSSGPPPEAPAVAAKTERITVAGAPREYVLSVPVSYDAKRAYPLILAFHGDGGNGAAMRAAYPIDEVARGQAIVAYPSGKNAEWDLYRPAATNGDLPFIDAIIAKITSELSIDKARIFATGFSSGAFLSNQLACRRSGLFRGIVVNAGGAPAEPEDPKATAWPNGYPKCVGQATGVAALIIHGTADSTVPVGSGDYAMKYWSYVNGCAAGQVSVDPPPCVAESACPAGKPVVYCEIPGLGHALWDQGVARAWAFIASL